MIAHKIFFWTLVIASVALLIFGRESITGFVSLESAGCCTLTCQQSSRADCPDYFRGGSCTEFAECNVGCCIDPEGYCLSNYLAGNCNRNLGRFITTNECSQEIRCITEQPWSSMLGSTGYPVLFKSYEKGIIYADPFAAKAGSFFTIKFLSEANQSVKVNLNTDSYNRTIALYDDGLHGDNNPNDGLYAAVWDSSMDISQLTIVNMTAVVDSAQAASDFLIITPNECIPYRKPWNMDNPDIFFISEQNIDSALGILAYNLESLSQYNIYATKSSITDPETAIQEIINTCPYNNDYIIFLDDFQSCEQSDKFIHASSQLFINRSADITNISRILNNFCSHVMTPKQLENLLIEKFTPPNITLLLPLNNSVYAESTIEVAFIVNDAKDTFIHYEVYADINTESMIMAKGNASPGNVTAVKVSLTDGLHDIWVEATDSDDNFAATDYVTININVANFIIDVLSLEPLYYNSSPDVNFTISHAFDTTLQYSIIANRTEIANGTAETNQVVSVPTNLNGSSIIRIYSKDSTGKLAYSLPYLIIIGEEE